MLSPSPCPSALIRKGRPSDADELAHVFATAWRHTYSGLIPDTYLDSMTRRRSARWWRRAIRGGRGLSTLVVEGKPVGYASYGAERGKPFGRGEILELYIVPDHQGLGLGELLFESCRHRLDLRHHRGLVTWALADNHRATDFYWRRGGRPFAETTEAIAGRKLQKIGFFWP